MQHASGCVAEVAHVLTRGSLTRIVEATLKPTDLIALLPAVNNGWAFAAFVIGLAVYLYLGRRDAP
jgi:type III secretory pathway component EscR